MTSRPNSIQAVLFDYGMVLSAGPDPAAWQQMLQITGFGEETLQKGYWAFRHKYDRGDLTGLEYWARVAEIGHTTFTSDHISRLIEADIALWTRLNAPMLDWAQRLQRASIRTGILSNIGDAMTEGLLKKFEWICGFHHCVWSYQLRLAKPEEAIYKAAANALDTPPENILFIDDKSENIEAARNAGMHAIQYRDHDSFEREMKEQGHSDLLEPVSVPAR
jgi:putative hydrolase of the HAD superfamily